MMEIRRLDEPVTEISPAMRGRLLTADGARTAVWQLAEEMPVAFLVNGSQFAVMMATPADLEDFAIGFALTERIADRPEAIDGLRIAAAADGYLVNLALDPDRPAKVEARRRTLAGRAGCGLCGAQSLEAVLPPLPRVRGTPLPGREALLAAFAALPAGQVMKSRNRTTHAAAFCHRDGRIALLREDIGRHNALDKLIGAIARAGLEAREGFILLSSRVSLEMVQKAVIVGTPLLAAVSAPSALALRVAGRAGLTVACRSGTEVMVFDPEAVR